jgi:hypothetical protein
MWYWSQVSYSFNSNTIFMKGDNINTIALWPQPYRLGHIFFASEVRRD